MIGVKRLLDVRVRTEPIDAPLEKLSQSRRIVIPSSFFGHRQVAFERAEEKGTVWKKADSVSLPGRRVPFWVKRKRGVEIEAFVTAAKAGTNGHAQVIGAVEFSIRNPDGTWVPVAWVSGWRDEERQVMTVRDADGVVRLNPDFIGRRAVLVGQDESAKSRRIRHARLKQWVNP